MKPLLLLHLAAAGVFGWGTLSRGDVPGAAAVVEEAARSAPATSGIRRALIICGHPGDDEHRRQFAETLAQMQTALVERYGFHADAVWVLSGGEDPPPADPGFESPRGPSTAESIAETVADLRSEMGPDDALWVIAMGHANYDRRHAWFNLPGPDLHEETFAALFSNLACRQQVFWITLPVSGYYIRPLSAPGRVIITATEADRELNETLFPHVMADVLSAEPPADAAAASSQTLLELYLAITRRVAEQFAGDMQVATEHAQLEANGDGKGSEVQYQHLPEDLGGGLKAGESPPAALPNSDEASAAAVVLQRVLPAIAAPSGEPAAPAVAPASEPDRPSL